MFSVFIQNRDNLYYTLNFLFVTLKKFELYAKFVLRKKEHFKQRKTFSNIDNIFKCEKNYSFFKNFIVSYQTQIRNRYLRIDFKRRAMILNFFMSYQKMDFYRCIEARD